MKTNEIERLGAESLQKMIRFDKLCFPEDFWKEEDWAELIRDERSHYYAFLHEDDIIANVFIYNWKGEADYVKIMNLSVHPDHRRKGLAHELLKYVSEEMRKDDMFRFRGETRASNTVMQKVFEDCGFKRCAVEKGYYDRPVEDAHKYALDVTDA